MASTINCWQGYRWTRAARPPRPAAPAVRQARRPRLEARRAHRQHPRRSWRPLPNGRRKRRPQARGRREGGPRADRQGPVPTGRRAAAVQVRHHRAGGEASARRHRWTTSAVSDRGNANEGNRVRSSISSPGRIAPAGTPDQSASYRRARLRPPTALDLAPSPSLPAAGSGRWRRHRPTWQRRGEPHLVPIGLVARQRSRPGASFEAFAAAGGVRWPVNSARSANETSPPPGLGEASAQPGTGSNRIGVQMPNQPPFHHSATNGSTAGPGQLFRSTTLGAKVEAFNWSPQRPNDSDAARS